MAEEPKSEERAPPPAWLDAAFVQKALRSAGGDHAQHHVEGVEVSHAGAPGDNYCSCISRMLVRVRGRAQPLVLLVKTLPEGEMWSNMVQEQRLFVKEGIVFSRVLPAMEALLAAAARSKASEARSGESPGRIPPFAARCLRHGDDPSPFIVLHDLGPDGFRLANRHLGLDLDHALLTVRALARFHAASAVLWRRRPEIFDGLVSPFEDRGCEVNVENFAKSFKSVAEAMLKWTDFPKEYGVKIKALSTKIYPKIQEVNRIRTEKFNVLIHGDFWVNNILFRYDDDVVREIRFVDYQMSHIGNPAIDLILLLYTSLTEEVYDTHWDTILEPYSSALGKTLQLLGEAAPSLGDIRQLMEEARLYSFLATLMWLPVIRLEKGAFSIDTALSELTESDTWVDDNMHNSPAFRRWMKKILPEFDRRGMFEFDRQE